MGKKLKVGKRILEESVGRGRAHGGFLRCWKFLDLGDGTEYSII